MNRTIIIVNFIIIKLYKNQKNKLKNNFKKSRMNTTEETTTNEEREIGKVEVSELYSQIKPMIDSAIQHEKPLTALFFAQMNDIVYTFYSTHYWNGEEYIEQMLTDIVKSYCSDRMKEISSLKEDLVLPICNEFRNWERIKRVLKTCFLTIDSLVHADYIDIVC